MSQRSTKIAVAFYKKEPVILIIKSLREIKVCGIWRVTKIWKIEKLYE
jgi:hypothetical protein